MAESETLELQIGELTSIVFDGSISEPQFDELKILLEKEPEARKIYAEFIGLHVCLQKFCFSSSGKNPGSDPDHQDHGTNASNGIFISGITATEAGDNPFFVGDTSPSCASETTFPRRWITFGLPGLAFLLLFVITLSFGWIGSGTKVARLIQQSGDAYWSDASGQQVEAPTIEPLAWYQLKKGIIHIEFGRGTEAFLQGPAQFCILDNNRLQMQSGKVSAKVPEAAHGFTVLTPNVKVVDLGTEFGVDASRLNRTFVQVTTGRVGVTTFDPDGIEKEQRELVANECFAVSRSGKLEKAPFESIQFARTLPDASIDLVDLVCGGDGTQQKRGYAINCSNGKWFQLTEPFTGKLPKHIPIGSKKFQPVSELPFVDGVFVPNNRRGPISVDSAGHRFAKFGRMSGLSYDCLMAGATLEFFKAPRYPERLMVDGRDFTALPHGLLVLRGNKGITFDLQKIRDANPGMKITKFRSLMANTENAAELNLVEGPFHADLWVIIDGIDVYRKTGLTSDHGTLNLDIPISENARFLTLVSTEGKKFSAHDWIVFANPTLELAKEE